MKNSLITLITCTLLLSCIISTSKAQDLSKYAAQAIITANKEQLLISNEPNNDVTVSNAYTDKKVGLTYIYLQQTFKNIKLYNVIKSCAFKGNILQSAEGDFIANLNAKTNSETFAITAKDAVIAAAKNLNIKVIDNNLKLLTDNFNATKIITFSNAGIAKKNIEAELIWFSADDNNSFKLAWNVSIDVANSSDFWTVRVDAQIGNVLDKSNYTVYEKSHSIEHSLATNSQRNFVEAKYTNAVKNFKGILTSSESSNYRVISFPNENRNYPNSIVVESNPWLKCGATNDATTYGWHFDGSTSFDYTQGNNVFAYDDSLKQNSPGRYPTSTTALPSLTFNFVPTFTKQPTLTNNREFATTNLFYWNNIMHDLYYQYGFTEAAGNFQADNLGRGGNGVDYVFAEAQDGGGTNNANFSTPPDGSNGRMQMYLWTTTSIKPDGDLDNGVIAHEFGHGISTRLTGGAANSSCLYNYEQAGEGWSDYFALMTTTDWTKSKITEGTKKRPVGTYVFNQPNTGTGIRTFPYSTDMSINPLTYLNVADVTGHPQYTSSGAIVPNATEVHFIGEVWCATLWDMTWNIIQQVGYISPNVFDATGTGGNIISIKLVMQGLKLQKCSPGFLDSRNAILKADSILYNNRFHCAIWNAFAQRGMGTDAIQGTSTKTNDNTDGYNAPCFSIAGKIINPLLLQPIKGAQIWSKKYGDFYNLMDSTTGDYSVNAFPIPNPVYYAYKNNDVVKANGVTSVDALLVQRHVLNTTKLNSAYKIIAADVDGNKTINSVDVLRIKRLILGTDTTFKNVLTNENRLWAFVDSSYSFPDTTNPFPFKDSISFAGLSANQTNQTFIGLKLGDVNYDWNAAIARQTKVNNLELVVSNKTAPTQPIDQVEKVSVLVFSSQSLSAMQTTIHFDNSKYEFISIDNNKYDIDFNTTHANKTGNISLVWIGKKGEAQEFVAGEELFTLVLRKRSTTYEQQSPNVLLSLNDDITTTAAYDGTLTEKGIMLRNQATNLAVNSLNNITIFPNPAHSQFTINCETIVGEAQVIITNVIGKQVYQSVANNKKITIDCSKLPKGFYTISLTTANSKSVQKLVIE